MQELLEQQHGLCDKAAREREELRRLEHQFQVVIAAHLDSDALNKVSDIKQGRGSAVVYAIQDAIKIWRLARVYDATVCSQEVIHRMHREVMAQAAKDCGLPHQCVPAASSEQLKAFLSRVNKLTDLEVPLRESPDGKAGWYCDPRYLVRAVWARHGGNNQDPVAGVGNDVVVVAFGTDKAPFYHNGRSLIIAQLEDMTMLRMLGTNPGFAEALRKLPEFKARGGAIMASCFESGDEGYDTLKSAYRPFSEQMKLHQEGFEKHKTQLQPLQARYREAKLRGDVNACSGCTVC